MIIKTLIFGISVLSMPLQSVTAAEWQEVKGIPIADLCSLDENSQNAAIDELLDRLDTVPGDWETITLSRAEIDALLAGVNGVYETYLLKPLRRKDGTRAMRHTAILTCCHLLRDVLSRVRDRKAIAYVLQNIYALNPPGGDQAYMRYVDRHLGHFASGRTVGGVSICNHILVALLKSEAVTPEVILSTVADGEVKAQGWRGHGREDFVTLAAYVVAEKVKAGKSMAATVGALAVDADSVRASDAVEIRDLASLILDPDSGLVQDLMDNINQVRR